MKRLLLAILVVVGLGVPTSAQVIDTLYVSAASADCSVASSCAVFNPGSVPAVTYTLSGTYAATLQFEGTADGINWVAINVVNVATSVNATSTTTSGAFAFANSGFLQVRVRCSAYTSGTVRISATRGFATARLVSPVVTTIAAADGTKALPSYTFVNEPSSGWYRAGTGDVRLSVLNTDRITADGTATRLRAPTGGANLNVGTGAVNVDGAALNFTSAGTPLFNLSSSVDGTILLQPQTPGTLSPILQFGGTTNQFPGLRRNSNTFEIIAADSSSYTGITVQSLGFGSPGSGQLRSLRFGNAQFINGTATVGLTFQYNVAPTCSANCGTSPTLVGSDTAAIVTMGATGVPASGWVVTFGQAWTVPPSCLVQSALSSMVVGKMPIAAQTSTTTLTVTTNGTAPGNSDKYAYLCIGVQ